MTPAQLRNLTHRVRTAVARGYKVAHVSHYAGLLGGEASTARELLALCENRGEPLPKADTEPAPVPDVHLYVVPDVHIAVGPEVLDEMIENYPPPVEGPPLEEDEEEDEVQDNLAPDYASWMRDHLYEEARRRDINGRADMNKAELIEALIADDAK